MSKKIILICIILIVLAITMIHVYRLINNNFVDSNNRHYMKENNVDELVENDIIENSNNIANIEMKIKDGTLTNSGATVIIYDYNQRNWYDPWYRIERLNSSGNWEEVELINEDVYWFFDIAWEIGKDSDNGTELELPTKWDNCYGKLEKGRYKLIKKVSGNEEISVEFEID